MTVIEYETDDLAATLDTISADADPAQLDAAASELLRWMSRAEKDLARYQEARVAELERIAFRYSQLTAPIEQRIAQLREAIGEIARRATFPGKSRSRKVGYGTYGLRKIPESVKVIDQGAALYFAHAHGLVEIRTTEYIPAAPIKAAVLEHLKATGEVPAGFEHIAERDEPVCKTMEVE